LSLQSLPDGLQAALALLTRPKQASAIPARPTPNRFSACRRVADWANPLASSSNLVFILFLRLVCLLRVQKKPLKRFIFLSQSMGTPLKRGVNEI
jgi:hypothetical protein